MDSIPDGHAHFYESKSNSVKIYEWLQHVTDHMRILPHTHMGWPVHVRDSPYAYGAIYVPHTHLGPHMPYG